MMMIKTPLYYEIDNDTGPNDESYWEFCRIYDDDDNQICTTSTEEAAIAITRIINTYAEFEVLIKEGRLYATLNENS